MSDERYVCGIVVTLSICFCPPDDTGATASHRGDFSIEILLPFLGGDFFPRMTVEESCGFPPVLLAPQQKHWIWNILLPPPSRINIFTRKKTEKKNKVSPLFHRPPSPSGAGPCYGGRSLFDYLSPRIFRTRNDTQRTRRALGTNTFLYILRGSIKRKKDFIIDPSLHIPPRTLHTLAGKKLLLFVMAQILFPSSHTAAERETLIHPKSGQICSDSSLLADGGT